LEHVEESNKCIIEETVRQIGYLPEVKEEIRALFTHKSDNCSGSETAFFPLILYEFESGRSILL
jgi:hypothetical protein